MLDDDKLLSESTLVTTLNEVVLPFWESQVQTSHFISPDNQHIHYAFAIPNDAHHSIVISPGRTEGYAKYQELTYELFQLGYAIFIVDHRGQGFSSRLLDNPHIGHVEEFSHYAEDFKQFIDDIVRPKSIGNLYLLAHSMGCAIAMLYMMNNESVFSRAALLSPMFGISSGFIPAPVARSLVDMFRDTLLWESNKEKYFPGQVDYHDKPFIDNPLTTSEVRFRIMQETFQRYPETQLGGISFHWLHNAIEATDHILNNIQQQPIPILLMSAGNDRVVDNNTHLLFQQKTGCEHQVVQGAEHELLFEKDEIRIATVKKVIEFFG